MTDGAQSHGLNELNEHFRGMAHRLREWYLCVCIYIYEETGKVVVINWDVLESVGPGHDIDGIE